MNSCPNYSDPKFKKIIEALGGDPIKATQYYHNYDGDVDLLYQDLVIDAQAGTTGMVKPRVAEVFVSSPELSEIGTPDQYSRYLDSVFPDSSVKDIFILSTPFNLIKDTSKGIQSQLAKYKKFKGFMVEPSNTGHPYGSDSLYKDYKVIIDPKGGLVTKLGKTGYVITSEARIHVLGSKSDVEGFRNFVKGDTDLGTTKRYEKTGPQDEDILVSKMAPPSEEQPEGYEEIKGFVGANKQNLIDLLGQRMYTADLSSVVMKEVLQNSFDAVKIGMNDGEIDKGKINITVNHDDRTITFEDNGVGMTPDIVQKAFFGIAESYKGEGVSNQLKSGGLGMAKVAFMFGSESIKLETVRNGKMTIVDATSAEIRRDDFLLVKQNTDKKNGTKLTVKIPEIRIDAKGQERIVSFPYEYIDMAMTEGILGKPLIGNVEVNYTNIRRGKTESKKTDLGNVPKGYELITTATTDWGSMDIYVDTASNGFMNEKESHKHEILSSGLYQFTKRFQKAQFETIPFNIIVNIKPNVSAKNEQYPFNNTREGFTPNVEADINALNHYLIRFYNIVQRDFYKKSFMTMTNIEKVDLDKVDEETIRRNKELIENTSLKDPEELRKKVQDRINEFKKTESITISEGGYTTSKGEEVTSEQIKQEEKQAEEKRYASSFRAAKEINVEQVKQETGLDPSKPFIHNNTDLVLDKNAAVFIAEMASLMHEYRDSYVKTYGEDHSPLNPNNQLWGVSIDKEYLGVNVNPKLMGLGILAINPFSILPHTKLNVENVTYISHALEHLIAHELNHNWARNEGAEFTSRFLHTDAELKSLPNHFELFQKLRKIVSNNIETLVNLKYAYEKAKNTQQSFDQNRLVPYESTGPEEGMGAVPEGTGEQPVEPGTEGSGKGTNIPLGEIILGIGKSPDNRVTQFKKLVKLTRKEVSGLQKNMALKRLKAANAELGTSFYIQFYKVGEADLYRYEIQDKSNTKVKDEKTQKEEPKSGDGLGQQIALFYAAPVNDPTYNDAETLTGVFAKLNADVTQSINNLDDRTVLPNQIIDRIASRLSGQLGQVPYEFITMEQAANLLAGTKTPYNNQPAFNLGGRVYFVRDRITGEIAMHEFAHPFIAALRVYNRKLYDKLAKELLATTEGKLLSQKIVSSHPHLAAGSDPYIDEIMVSALGMRMSYKRMGIDNSTGFKAWLKNLLYQIKKYLREMFGSKIDISKLDTDTTLDDLASMLEKGGMFDVKDVTVTDADVAAFYAMGNEIIEDIKKVDDNEVSATFKRTQEIVSRQLRLMENNEQFKDLAYILQDKYDENEFEEILKNINRFTTNIKEKLNDAKKELAYNNARASAMLDTLARLNVVLKRFNEHMDNLLTDKNKKENAFRAFHYRAFVDHYRGLINEFKEAMEDRVPANSPLRALLNALETNVDDITRKTQSFSSEAASIIVYEQLSLMADYLDRKYITIIDEITKKAEAKGQDPKIARDYWFKEWKGMNEEEFNEYERLKEIRSNKGYLGTELENRYIQLQNKLFDGVQITKEKIELAIRGIGPDANAFSSFLEGYLYNPDIVVGGMALYIKNNMTDVLMASQAKMNDFFTEMVPVLEAAGYKPNAVQEFADKIVRLQTIGRTDEAGNFTEKEVFAMLSDFKDYRIARDRLRNEISAAQKEYTLSNASPEAKQKLALAQKALEDLERKYFHNPYHPIFYERYNMFDNNNPLHVEAWRRYKEALDEIDNFNKEVYSEDIFMDTKDARDLAWKKYKDLFSLHKDGKPKTGDELAITQLLINFRKETQKFWEFVPRTGSMMKALHRYQQQLIDQGIPKTDPKHAEKVKEWIEANTVPKVKQSWYEARTILINRYKKIMEKLDRDELLAMDVSDLFKRLIDISYPYRNQNGQINASDMSEKERKDVRDIELEMIKAKERLRKSSGMTAAETERLEQLMNKLGRYMITGVTLTLEERNELEELTRKSYNTPKLTDFEKSELRNISKSLFEMSSKIPTEDYIEELNDVLEDPKIQEILTKYNIPLEYKAGTLYQLMGEYKVTNPIINELKKASPRFNKWFNDSHYEMTVWEEAGNGQWEQVYYYKRIFVFNQTIPSDENDMESMEIEEIDGQKYTIPRVPSLRFAKRQVKDFYVEYDKDGNITKRIKLKTDKIVGVTKDNQGEWLPRLDVKDSPFIDERYQQLKNSTDPMDRKVFEALEKLKANHLKNQEGLSNRAKLYLDLPRYRKDNLEALQTRKKLREMKKSATNTPPDDPDNKKGGFLQLIMDRVREFFTGSAAQAELDGTGAQLNYDDKMLLVRTDIFDNEISRMPMSGLSDIDSADVSLDIPRSLMRYMLGAERHKKLIEINPGALMIQESVQMNSPKDSNRFSKWWATQGGVLKRVNTKNPTEKARAAKDISTREKAITNLYEREFLGQSNTGIGSESALAQNLANGMFRYASFGYFALNIGSAIKNAIGPKIQGAIMSAGGEYMTGRSYAKGEKWSFNTMFELSFGLYKAAPASMNVQLMEIMDIIPDRLQNKFGERISRTLTRDAANMGWLYNFRKWTESQSTLALGGGMMSKQMVETTDGSKVAFIDAWQVVDGKIQLKPNIDPSWGITYDENGNMKVGDKFKFFRNRVQQAGTLMQGAYGQFEQPEAQRYLGWRFISYLRRYFTTMFINRVGFTGAWDKPTEWRPRHNYGLGDVHMGYYVSVIRTIARAFKNKGYLSQLTPQEKADIYKLLTEIGILVALMALLGPLFGWDPEDDEKYEKLKKKSGPLPLPGVVEDPRYPFRLGGWLENHALLMMMQVRNENDQFIPFPNFGLDDYVGLLNLKSVAIDPTLKTFEDSITSLYNAALGNDAAYYKRAMGPYEWQQEDSLKLYQYVIKSFGITGSQTEPIKGIKDLISIKSRQ